MTVLTLAEPDPRLVERLADPAGVVVVCLCAAWCSSCRDFRASYERLAAGSTEAVYAWLDVEDDSELCGEVEVESFPTLAVYRGADLLHFGASPPHAATIARLVAALGEQLSPIAAEDAVAAIAARLRARFACR